MKRLISILLALSLLIVPLSAAASAAEQKRGTETYTASELSKIETEREQLYNLIRVQLKAQNAENHFETFRYLADDYIQAKYYPVSTRGTRNSATIYAPNGGWTSAENSDVFIFTLFLNEADTQKAFENKGQTLTQQIFSSLAWKFISTMVGFPFLGTIANFSQKLSESLSWDMIMNSTKCLSYTNSYDKAEMKNIIVQMPWYNVPNISLPNSSLYTVAYGVT